MEWSEDAIGRLRMLWTEGHSTAEIGRRLGISKNAVVGKAHRLDLPSRPSPIRREAGPGGSDRRRAAPRRAAGPTLPPLTSTAAPSPSNPGVSAEVARPGGETAVRRPVQPLVASSTRVQGLPRTYGRTIACCWPLGEPGSKNFHFCCDDSVPGKPYCEEHARLAYVRVRDRHEDAA
jgi:GcrA cell cycle regulator